MCLLLGNVVIQSCMYYFVWVPFFLFGWMSLFSNSMHEVAYSRGCDIIACAMSHAHRPRELFVVVLVVLSMFAVLFFVRVASASHPHL